MNEVVYLQHDLASLFLDFLIHGEKSQNFDLMNKMFAAAIYGMYRWSVIAMTMTSGFFTITNILHVYIYYIYVFTNNLRDFIK